MAPQRIVVVGAGLAGARTCEQLRSQGYAGEISLLSGEAALPYDRPPLSKAVLVGKSDDTALAFDTAALNVSFEHRPAAGLRVEDRVVETATGDVPFDGLVIATGTTAVRLPGSGPQATLRTLEDALAIREKLLPGSRVVIVGASWIGAEVATSALALGAHVTCIEAAKVPSQQVLGETVGGQLLPLWQDVDLRLDTKVASIEDGGVVLADGSAVPGDVVVVGVGVRPETGWLASSGLLTGGWVHVDEHLQAAPGIVAVGDVAAWHSARWGRRMRAEHWETAATAGAIAAATLLGGAGEGYDPVPYFWSDQFGRKVQYIGSHLSSDTPHVRVDAKGWSGFWTDADGRLTAAVFLNRARDMVRSKQWIDARCRVDPAILVDGSADLADAILES